MYSYDVVNYFELCCYLNIKLPFRAKNQWLLGLLRLKFLAASAVKNLLTMKTAHHAQGSPFLDSLHFVQQNYRI